MRYINAITITPTPLIPTPTKSALHLLVITIAIYMYFQNFFFAFSEKTLGPPIKNSWIPPCCINNHKVPVVCQPCQYPLQFC